MNTKQNFLHQWEPLFIQHRRFLISFVFRMTGSLSEAEDIAQEAYIDCASVNPADINNHKSWLTKICSNKSIDHLRSAYKRRESYSGTWLPDAIPDSYQIENNLMLSESVTTTFLLMVEKLGPEERVIYILNEVFDYSFKEIAEMLNKSDDNCRKIAQRARSALLNEKTKFSSSEDSVKIVQRFFDYAKLKDKSALIDLMSDDSELWTDGGGKIGVFAKTVLKDKIKTAGFFSALGGSKVFHSEEHKVEVHYVNSRPGLIVSNKLANGSWVYDTLISFEIEGDKIARIYAQRNPEKLEALLKLPSS